PVFSVITEISYMRDHLSRARRSACALHTSRVCLPKNVAGREPNAPLSVGHLQAGVRMVKKGSQQRDLVESERSFRLLVEGVADYALYMLDPSGVITSWNIGGERIKGYSPEEILGQHFSRFYTETDRANGKPARALGIAREKGRYEEEGWRVRKDGTFFW